MFFFAYHLLNFQQSKHSLLYTRLVRLKHALHGFVCKYVALPIERAFVLAMRQSGTSERGSLLPSNLNGTTA